MAVTFSAQNTGTGGATGITVAAPLNDSNLTVQSGDTILILCMANDSGAPTLTPTWDFGGTNQAMTKLVSAAIGNGQSTIWGLLNPTVGNKTMRVTTSGTCVANLWDYTFQGNTTSSIGAAVPATNTVTSNSAPATQAITQTGGTGDQTVCVVGYSNNVNSINGNAGVVNTGASFASAYAPTSGGSFAYSIGLTAGAGSLVVCTIDIASGASPLTGSTVVVFM